MKINKKSEDYRIDKEDLLAGGYGMCSAKQNPEALLRRAVMACLLWEDVAYSTGESVADNIIKLIPKVKAGKCFVIAVEARNKQKLRHVPLLIAREMARLSTHKFLVGKLLPEIIQRADEITEFMAIYWKDGRQPISKQVKIGLSNSFNKFNEYQFAKYNRNETIKLRDVMFMVHPKPENNSNELFDKITNNTLEVPDTWEVALSTGKNKKETWERLINNNKIGALAFLRNLRNMEDVGVDRKVIQYGFESINPYWLLPLNYFSASKYAPNWEREIEQLMLKGFENKTKLSGYTIFVVDVSGSMESPISGNSTFNRMDVAKAMSVIASEMCEHISIYITAGNDSSRIHSTKKIKPRRGFGLCDEIHNNKKDVGGGGIFTRQCLDYIKENETDVPDRIIIFSDSQDCDYNNSLPSPFGKYNYIIDVSSHSKGINYNGIWTAEISGWSEHFLNYIFASEGLELHEEQDNPIN